MTRVRTPRLRFPGFSDDWAPHLLGDVASFSKGHGIPATTTSGEGVFPAIRYGELYTTYGEIIEAAVSFVDTMTPSQVRSRGGEVLVPASGESAGDIARASYVRHADILIGSDINIIRGDKWDGRFLAYALTHAHRRQLTKLAQGVSVVHLNASNLKQLPILLPSLEEQRAIADFLEPLDVKISLVRRRIDVLRSYRNDVATSLLTAGAAEVSLNSMLRVRSERNGSAAVTEVFSVAKDAGVVNQIEHLGRSYAAENLLAYKVVHPGDVVYTKSPVSGFPFGIVKQNRTGRMGLVSPLYGVYVPSRTESGFLVDAYFRSGARAVNYLAPLVTRGAKNTINATDADFLRGAPIAYPKDANRALEAASLLEAIDLRINLVRRKLEYLRTWKRGLTQQLFV